MTTTTMLRFIIARELSLLSQRGFPTANRQVKHFTFPQSCCLCVQRVNIFTKSQYRIDDTRPLARDLDHGPDSPIDLDKWKNVMRAKAITEEKQLHVNDEENDDEEVTEQDMTLEATRELVSMWRLAGKLVPEQISDEDLQHLAGLPAKSARKKYLKYLAIKEGHKKSRKEKQQKKKAEKEQQRMEMDAEKEEGDDQKQPEMKSSLFLKYWSKSLDNVLAWRSAQAMLFGQPLVFDLSYEDNMSTREIQNTVSQLIEAEGWNKRAIDPYHLYFCNLQPDSYYKQGLLKRYGEEAWEKLFVTNTEKPHYEVFPREQLVYLTADSPNVLHIYDHSKVYIIGGLVDRSIQKGLTLANAKRLKLATVRLPLDEYLYWETGAKNLTLDQMIRILLSLKETGNWEEALKFVPTRKHDGFHSHKQKEMKSVVKTFKFGSTPKTEKAKTWKTKPASKQKNWWDDE